jgi:hypothetical protein
VTAAKNDPYKARLLAARGERKSRFRAQCGAPLPFLRIGAQAIAQSSAELLPSRARAVPVVPPIVPGEACRHSCRRRAAILRHSCHADPKAFAAALLPFVKHFFPNTRIAPVAESIHPSPCSSRLTRGDQSSTARRRISFLIFVSFTRVRSPRDFRLSANHPCRDRPQMNG